MVRVINDIDLLSTEWHSRNGQEAAAVAVAGAEASAERRTDAQRETNGRYAYNARLRAYGRKLSLHIPKVCMNTIYNSVFPNPIP